jgi:hypothetical protein
MKRVLAVCAGLAVFGLSMSPTRAEMSSEMARATVAPFHKALNAKFVRHSPDRIKQPTAAG